MNKNYVRGRKWEYQTLKYLKNLDSFGFGGRMAGSHGLADVVWVSPRDSTVYFIQNKVTKKKCIGFYDPNHKCYKKTLNTYKLFDVVLEKWTKKTR